jgi:hypothetical protein
MLSTKGKGMHSEERRVLLDALERDPNNPLGRFEFAYILETEKQWADSLREYETAKRLVKSVTGPAYIDARGNAYTVEAVRQQVDKAIERVAKLNEASNETYSPRSADEIGILSVLLKAEFQANKWTKNERTCFSVKGLDPSPELVETLRQHLNVCSSAEWRSKFDCGYPSIMKNDLSGSNAAFSAPVTYSSIFASSLFVAKSQTYVWYIATISATVPSPLKSNSGEICY